MAKHPLTLKLAGPIGNDEFALAWAFIATAAALAYIAGVAGILNFIIAVAWPIIVIMVVVVRRLIWGGPYVRG